MTTVKKLSYAEKLNRISVAQGSDVQHTYTQPELAEIQKPEYEWSNVNWLHAVLLTTTPALAAYGVATTPLEWKTGVWSVFWYTCTGLGITAGYHRLWAHKSYTAGSIYQSLFAFFGAGAFQGSIRWWSRGHRQHHRYTDTQKDPYSARKGAFWSHMGWMLVHEKPKNRGYVDITDLDRDPLVRFQHNFYLPIAIFGAFVFPTLVAGYGWGDWRGGFFYAGILRQVLIHHATFCVNSLAHLIGEQPFDDRLTPRNHFITALVTLGEGNHNFHHEYPTDYRNAIKWWQYDPTKWVIWAASVLGLTWDLHEFPSNEIRKGEIKMIEKKINDEKAHLDYGVPVEELPGWSFAECEFKAKAAQEKLIVIDNVVYTVGNFMDEHPGGANLLKFSIGHDVTYQFNGGVYFHNNAARNMMQRMRVARITGDPSPLEDDLVVDDDEKWVGLASGKVKAV
ncbi:hypothetical protein M427DRAFT_105886 [Gonapodya prolifera JEL478]|uniref:Acyl-CoA desaturase n=1 Tax=Gonapodya prolifera (strain JEL478) TaxID=1344416 RepID=A0A138ZXJ0_GONPJ|nr:hypothetical protein M427DRAFT_105886 [Gonapodya prolifera JEL478]|eukprot:KXS09194.1 hypothetical protein M427DRAFT_105886 [Gonapodya prolifera JEL478]